MGNFHSNVVVKGPSQDQIVAYLRDHQQHACVSPTRNDITFVYDQDWGVSADVLSSTFDCVALREAVHDSDIFYYKLYGQGQLIDEYNSAPDYFDGQEWTGPEEDEPGGPHQPEPEGGNARVFCTAFGVEHLTQQVDAILHPPVPGAIRHTTFDAFHQHWALAEALGWPPSACVTDFKHLDSEGIENLVEGFNGGDVIRTP